LIETLAIIDFVVVDDLLWGKFIFMSFGVDMVDEITKNNNKRKIISVIDAIEKPASILFLFFNAIIFIFLNVIKGNSQNTMSYFER
jgi:hypothetical protein